MSKTELREKAGITTNALAEMGRDENVSTEVLCKICRALNCKLEDVVEIMAKYEGQRNTVCANLNFDLIFD